MWLWNNPVISVFCWILILLCLLQELCSSFWTLIACVRWCSERDFERMWSFIALFRILLYWNLAAIWRLRRVVRDRPLLLDLLLFMGTTSWYRSWTWRLRHICVDVIEGLSVYNGSLLAMESRISLGPCTCLHISRLSLKVRSSVKTWLWVAGLHLAFGSIRNCSYAIVLTLFAKVWSVLHWTVTISTHDLGLGWVVFSFQCVTLALAWGSSMHLPHRLILA